MAFLSPHIRVRAQQLRASLQESTSQPGLLCGSEEMMFKGAFPVCPPVQHRVPSHTGLVMPPLKCA